MPNSNINESVWKTLIDCETFLKIIPCSHGPHLAREKTATALKITAVRILAELGDIRRFSNPNKINAFVGIDPGRYQSGEKDSSLRISKHGNAVARKILYRAIGQIDLAAKTSPCHIADYYERKKQFSQTKGFKKIAIASIHKLLVKGTRKM